MVVVVVVCVCERETETERETPALAAGFLACLLSADVA